MHPQVDAPGYYMPDCEYFHQGVRDTKQKNIKQYAPCLNIIAAIYNLNVQRILVSFAFSYFTCKLQ